MAGILTPDSIEIDGRRIGSGERSFLIAEISANHDRDLEHALRLVDVAADAGWDCLKLQTYNADTLTMRSDHPSMKVDPVWGYENLYELYDSAHMPMEFHEPLFARARERGMLPITSIYDPRDLDFIESLGCEVYKISSFEMTFDDLLAVTAQTGKPIILSTGMATISEIKHAMEVIFKNGSPPVILLHCCSSYPAPFDEINLNVMETMRLEFGGLVGFSDHTIGSIGPLTAVAMGAVVIEKHFTNDITRRGPDHRFSATPQVMKEIAEGVDQIHMLKGGRDKKTTDTEQVSKSIGRRSAFALHELKAGHTVTEADFRFIRPSGGISPTEKSSILGQVLSADVPQGFPIRFEDLKL